MKDIDRIEIIRSEGDQIQLRIQKGDNISSYIIDPDHIEKNWIDNIFSMSVTMIKNTEKK